MCLRLLDYLHVQQAVTLDFVQEFLWPHVAVAKADVLEVLIQSGLDCTLYVLLETSDESLDNNIVALFDSQGGTGFRSLIFVRVVAIVRGVWRVIDKIDGIDIEIFKSYFVLIDGT